MYRKKEEGEKEKYMENKKEGGIWMREINGN